MLCLGSRTLGVKDTPFLGLVWGAKEAGKRLPWGTSSKLEIYVLASITETQGVTQVQAARRLTALLLHVWIRWFVMVILQGWFSGVPGRWVDGG